MNSKPDKEQANHTMYNDPLRDSFLIKYMQSKIEIREKMEIRLSEAIMLFHELKDLYNKTSNYKLKEQIESTFIVLLGIISTGGASQSFHVDPLTIPTKS